METLALDGKVAIVTGGAQRIGSAIVRTLASRGAIVLLVDIRSDLGEEVVLDVQSRGGEAAFLHADVGNPHDIQGVIATAEQRFGRLDILVNNAHWEKRGSVVDLEEEDWDRSFDVLLKAIFRASKYAIPIMQQAGGGVIVNIASVLAYGASDHYVAYNTAKAAVIQLTRQIAWDFGPVGIRCNCICPGEIRPIAELREKSADLKYMEERLLLKALKRLGRPEDVAAAALFLVSELAEWITGESITVDGGEFLTFPMVGAERMKALLKSRNAE